MQRHAELFALARRLFAERDPDATAALLLREVRALTGADRGFIVVQEGRRYVQKLAVDYDDGQLSNEERSFSRTAVQRAIESQTLVALDEPGDDPDALDSVLSSGARAVRVAPLVCEGKSVGAIYLDRRRGGFAADASALLGEIADLAARIIHDALERAALVSRNRHLERDLFARHDFRGIVTTDERMLALLGTVAKVADSDATVLERGETGTGKELIANAVHLNSPRARRPFVVVHCSALPAQLLESELFGHKKGAFTGADRERVGRLATADGGTLFLDEVAELSPEVQAKLLRFLQFGEVQRVGADRADTVDARVIAATHADLAALVAERRFRQDLYFRLKVVELTLPPLRERPGDILAIARDVLGRRWKRAGEAPRFTPRAERALVAHGWPGNVRELAHVVERACILAAGPEIDVDALPPELLGAGAPAAPARFSRYDVDELAAAREDAVAVVERDFVLGLLERAAGNVSQAARMSGMNRTYLQRLVGRYRRE